MKIRLFNNIQVIVAIVMKMLNNVYEEIGRADKLLAL